MSIVDDGANLTAYAYFRQIADPSHLNAHETVFEFVCQADVNAVKGRPSTVQHVGSQANNTPVFAEKLCGVVKAYVDGRVATGDCDGCHAAQNRAHSVKKAYRHTAVWDMPVVNTVHMLPSIMAVNRGERSHPY